MIPLSAHKLFTCFQEHERNRAEWMSLMFREGKLVLGKTACSRFTPQRSDIRAQIGAGRYEENIISRYSKGYSTIQDKYHDIQASKLQPPLKNGETSSMILIMATKIDICSSFSFI